jgi:hypothetical protein
MAKRERCKHGMVKEWCAFCKGRKPSNYNPAAVGTSVLKTLPIDRKAARTCEGGMLWEDYS